MASERRTNRKKNLAKSEIRSLLGPCMITFAIPLFIPGLTITLVAFSDETGFSKYGALHVIGMLILCAACVLLCVGCVMKCACGSRIHPLVDRAPHKVTTHEEPKQALGKTLTRDRLPPLNQGPQPGGSSEVRETVHITDIPASITGPRAVLDPVQLANKSKDAESITSNNSESNVTQSKRKYTVVGLPESDPFNELTDKTEPIKASVILVNEDTYASRNRVDAQSENHEQKSTGYLTHGDQLIKDKLMCPSSSDLCNREDTGTSKDAELGADTESSPEKDKTANSGNAWISQQSQQKSFDAPQTGSPSCSESSGDVTLTGGSRNCSAVPELVDLVRDDSVEVDRFHNVWRGDSANSMEISSVLSRDTYSEESLSVVSKDQLEIAEAGVSRGRTSTDSAIESAGDHSRALSRRNIDRVHSDLVEHDLDTHVGDKTEQGRGHGEAMV